MASTTTVKRRPGNAQTLLKLFPNIKKVLIAFSVIIGLALAVAIFNVISPSPAPPAKTTYQMKKFYLPPRGDNTEYEEVPTVDVGPGTSHRLRADAPYRAISLKPDGTSKTYNMPAGWETWNGAAPAGKLRLICAVGAKEKTLVEITRVR